MGYNYSYGASFKYPGPASSRQAYGLCVTSTANLTEKGFVHCTSAISWLHMFDMAIVSYTSNMPQSEIVN